MRRKAIAGLLLFAILLSVSCSEGQVSEDVVETTLTETTASETTADDGRDKSDLPDEYDLGGYTLRLLSRTENTNATSMYLVAPDEANGEVLNDTIYERNVEVFAKYNFDIENIYADDVMSAVNQAVLAGDDIYDIALPYLDRVAPRADSGLYMNLYDVENLNLSKNYWDQNFHSSLSLGGKLYFTTGDIMVADDDVLLLMLYNRDLADDLGIENLYDAVWDGRWTYDLMRQYVKEVASDLDGDGKITENDQIGFLWASNNCAAPHFAAVNSLLFVKDENDYPVMSDNTERAYDIFDILTELLDHSRYSLEWLQFGSEQVSVITNLVSNKQVLFQNMILSQLRRLYRDVTADFGILPMPKYDEAQDNYYTTLWKSFEVITIPATNSHTAETGFILEALAAASGEISQAYYDICLESKYTRDAESFDMIELSRENVIYDIGFIYDWSGIYTEITSAAAGCKGNLASLLATYGEPAVAAAKSFIENFK